MSSRRRILIVAPGQEQRQALARVLDGEGYATRAVGDGTEALAAAGETPVDLVVADGAPGVEGLAFVRRLRGVVPDVPLLVAGPTGLPFRGAEGTGVDYLRQPLDADELVHRVAAALRERALRAENAELRKRLLHRERGDGLLGASQVIVELRKAIARVARMGSPVLVLGERGSGKDLVAETIHFRSARAPGPFLKVHGAEWPGGGGTGALERAHGGTLFVDDADELSPASQQELEGALQVAAHAAAAGSPPRPDVRLVAASSRPLEAERRAGRFREDLYRSLAAELLHLPPLRERAGDAALLAVHFAREAGAWHGRPIDRITPGALGAVRRHAWPENVRELREAIENAVIRGSGPEVSEEELALGERSDSGPGAGEEDAGRLVQRLLNSELPFDEFERELHVRALRRTRGNQSRAARLLGMTRRTLQYRIEKFAIDAAALRG